MHVKARFEPRQLCAAGVRYVIILIALGACSPAVPLRPTAAVGVTTSLPMDAQSSPLATPGMTPASTATELPLQPVASVTFVPTPTNRLALADQFSTVDTSRAGWWSIQTLGPVGQTFRPSFAGLDAVELWTEDQYDAECSGAGARLKINIREAALDGPLVGSSAPVLVPDCFKGIVFFGFPSLVAVTPDKVYAVEVVATPEDNWGVVWQQVPDAYPRGESIVLGAASDADIWFREGLRSSTPQSEDYCQNGLWQHVTRADGSAFRNQGDCFQYVKIGR